MGKDEGLPKDNLAISIQFKVVLAVSCRGFPGGGGCLTFLHKGNTAEIPKGAIIQKRLMMPSMPIIIQRQRKRL